MTTTAPVYFTGINGDLGRSLLPLLAERFSEVRGLDLDPRVLTLNDETRKIQCRHGSLNDADLLHHDLEGASVIVHSAALHGIHEFQGIHSRPDFWQTNVTGTFNLLEGARATGVKSIVFISSSSVFEEGSFYGISKRMGEKLIKEYCNNYGMSAIVLRPRAFIPPWRLDIYPNIADWVRWSWSGFVHLDDVAQAVLQTINRLQNLTEGSYEEFTIDSKIDFSPEELKDWQIGDAGKNNPIRRKYPELAALADRHAIAIDKVPTFLDTVATTDILKFEPNYGHLAALGELSRP